MHPLRVWAVPGGTVDCAWHRWDTPVSGDSRLLQVGCNFSFPEASGVALINMAIGGTKAVLQHREIIGVHVDVTCG